MSWKTLSAESLCQNSLLHLLLCTAVGVASSLCTVNGASMPRNGLGCFVDFLQTPQHFRHSTGGKWGVQIPSLCGIAGPQRRFQSFQSCSWKACALALALFSPHCTPATQTPHSFEAILPKNLPSGRLQSFPLGLVALFGEEKPERERDRL